MTGITIINDSYTEVTKEADTDDEWDKDDTQTSHDIRGFEIVKGYSDLEIGFDPEHDKTYFLLYAIYGTGDSFSRDEGRIEYVDLYQDENLAYENMRKLEKETKKEEYSAELLHENGKTFRFQMPWIGYFETLQSIDVMAVRRI